MMDQPVSVRRASPCRTAASAAEGAVEEECCGSESDLCPPAAVRLLLSCPVCCSQQLPTVVRLWRASSAAGRSFVTLKVVFHWSFSSSWGERLLTVVQSAAIVFLIAHHRGNTVKGIWTCFHYEYFFFLNRSFHPIYRFTSAPSCGERSFLTEKYVQRKSSWRSPLWRICGLMFQCVFIFPGFPLAGLWLLSAYTTAMFFLGSYAAAAVVSLLHESRLAALIASKVLI